MTTADELPLDAPLPTRISFAIERYGEEQVAQMSIGLLQGKNQGDEILLLLGGRHARGVLDGAPPLYWPELWGARALTTVWSEATAELATSAILAGLSNRAWRVREMCAKVCAARGVGGTEALAGLLDDEVPRVRSAAARAIAELGTSEHLDILRALVKDADKDVRRSAQLSLDRLRERTRPVG